MWTPTRGVVHKLFWTSSRRANNACSAGKSIGVNNVSVKKELPGHLKELYDKPAENLNLEQKNKLYELLCDNSDLFAKSSSDLRKTSGV